MILAPIGVRVWLATGVTDMGRGMNALALQAQESLGLDPTAAPYSISEDVEATPPSACSTTASDRHRRQIVPTMRLTGLF